MAFLFGRCTTEYFGLPVLVVNRLGINRITLNYKVYRSFLQTICTITPLPSPGSLLYFLIYSISKYIHILYTDV